MKEIRFTSYFKDRLKIRRITEEVSVEVLNYAEQRFYDRSTGRFIAIKNVKVAKRRSQQLMLAYEDHDDYLLAVTIHTITNQQINSHLRSGRWIRQ